jgi:sulfur-oxidizing protein SoxY
MGHPVDRRAVLAGALVAAAMAPISVSAEATKSAAAADPPPLVPTAQFGDAFSTVIGNGTPIEGRVTLELPEYAENGNIVPYKISIESPMSDEDYIRRVTLLSTQNPQATVAVFHFTPLSGKGTVSGRMRLAKTQEVVAVALTSTNSLLIGRQMVDVGIGGCGTE